MNNPKMKSVLCSLCLRETEHEILFDKTNTESESLLDADQGIKTWSGYQYILYECAGCKNIVMYKGLRSSEIFHEDYGEWCDSWHPPRKLRRTPSWCKSIPQEERNLIEEILISINSSCLCVAAMGLRALFDMFVVRLIGDSGTFKKKVSEMVRLGYLSAKQKELIDPVLEVGHAASHRGYSPDAEAVIFTLDVIENMLHQNSMASNVPEGVKNAPKRK